MKSGVIHAISSARFRSHIVTLASACLLNLSGAARADVGAAEQNVVDGKITRDGIHLFYKIVGQASGNGVGGTSAGDRSDPLTAAGPSSIDGVSGASSVPSNVPINVHQESNAVPLNLKPIVRDYFSDAGS